MVEVGRLHLVKDVAIVLGAVLVIVVYNWAPYWTRKLHWIPKTRLGQTLWLVGLLVFLILCVVSD